MFFFVPIASFFQVTTATSKAATACHISSLVGGQHAAAAVLAAFSFL